MDSLGSFEEELISAICYTPNFVLTKETMNAGLFCWSWLSNIRSFPRGSLLLHLSNAILIGLNAGGIFDSQSIICSLLSTNTYNSIFMDGFDKKQNNDVFFLKAENYTNQLLQRVPSDRLSTILYSEHYYYINREDVLEGLKCWLKFLNNQLKVKYIFLKKIVDCYC